MDWPFTFYRKLYVDQRHLEIDDIHGVILVAVYPTYVDAEIETYFDEPLRHTLRKVIEGTESITYENVDKKLHEIAKQYFDWPTYLYQDSDDVPDEGTFKKKYESLDKNAEYNEYFV